MKTIVVLGAGFGGLRCALDLAQRVPGGWKVVLVDRNAYQVYSPRLYDTAIPDDLRGGEEMEKSRVVIADILRSTRVEFVQGEVKGVDCKGRSVLVDGARIPYGYLVLALGAGTDYFEIPGLQEYARTLKSLEDAGCIRGRVEEFLKYTEDRPPGRRRTVLQPFSIVIGGAGATGVEVAAELAYLFRKVPREHWSITLVEALSSVLWMFPKAVGEYADKRLRKLGVHVMLDTCIKRVDRAHSREIATSPTAPRNDGGLMEVTLAPRPLKPGETEAALACDFLPEHEKQIRADLLLWAGGIRANPLLAACGMAVDRKGRVAVDEYLQVKSIAGVFALGDNATLINPAIKQPVPATAQAALEQGKLVAQNLVRTIQGQYLQPYRFHDFSAVVPLADRDGVALIGQRVIRGFPAWVLRKAADCRYFASILGWWKAVKECIMK